MCTLGGLCGMWVPWACLELYRRKKKNPSATRKTAERGEGRALEMSVIDRESVNQGSQTHAPK